MGFTLNAGEIFSCVPQNPSAIDTGTHTELGGVLWTQECKHGSLEGSQEEGQKPPGYATPV